MAESVYAASLRFVVLGFVAGPLLIGGCRSSPPMGTDDDVGGKDDTMLDAGVAGDTNAASDAGVARLPTPRAHPKAWTLARLGRLHYDSDLTHVTNVHSCYNVSEQHPRPEHCTEPVPDSVNLSNFVFNEYKLRASVREVTAAQVEVGYKFNPGLGRAPLWQKTDHSGVSPKDHFEWFREQYLPDAAPDFDNFGSIGRYVYNGGDTVAAFIDEANKHPQVHSIISLRMNDHHHLVCLVGECEPNGVKGWHSIIFTKFLLDNKDRYFISHPDATGLYEQGLNYAYPEVRAMYMGLIRDLVHNYDAQALELNFMRSRAHFPPPELCPDGVVAKTGYGTEACPSLERRSDIMTEFIGDVRTALGDRPLIVKGPLKLESAPDGWDHRGLDVTRLADDVDAFVFAHFYYLSETYRSDIAKARALVPNRALYQEIHFAWNREPVPGEPGPIRKAHNEQLYDAANWAYENGADGLSLFNFQYYPFSLNNPRLNDKYRPIPFGTFPHMSEREWLNIHTEQTLHSFAGLRNHPHVMGDFDGNGTDDVAFLLHQDGTLVTRLLLSSRKTDDTRGGLWRIEDQRHPGWRAGLRIAQTIAGDFDGNGVDDIAFLVPTKDQRLGTRVLYGGRGGEWDASRRVVAVPWDERLSRQPRFVGKLNDDATDDVVFVVDDAEGNATTRVLLGHPDGEWETPPHSALSLPLEDSAQQWIWGDVNGDGLMDLTSLGDADGRLSVATLVADGHGGWLDGLPTTLRWGAAFRNAPRIVGDVTGDNAADFTVLTSQGEFLALRTASWQDGRWRSRGNSVTSLPASFRLRKFVAADFGGDGRIDLSFLTGTGPVRARRLTTTRLKSVRQAQWIESPAKVHGTWDGAIRDEPTFVGDFNGDGRGDIMFLTDSSVSRDQRQLLKVRQLLGTHVEKWMTW